jgi:Mor family transcriptional regulator
VDFATLKFQTILRSGVGMKYIKADMIFPEYLLKEIQKYVHGELIYIPNPEGVRKKWGFNSGNRNYLNQRNQDIRNKFCEGLTINQLSDKFCLSFDSIKKIVYSNK